MMYKIFAATLFFIFVNDLNAQPAFSSKNPNFMDFYGSPNVKIYTSFRIALRNATTARKIYAVNANLNNKIQRINRLVNLELLYLEKCQISILPNDFKNLKNLLVFVSKSNPIQHIEPGFTKNKNLLYLELWNTKLDSLPRSLDNLDNLTLLRIFNNSADTVYASDSIKRLVNLESIQLVNVNLYDFPNFILRCKNLKNLTLVNCQIDSIPEALFYLPKLKTLNLSGNNIRYIPEVLTDMESLKHINLSKNKIFNLPEDLAYMPNLKILNVKDNFITLRELDILRVLCKYKIDFLSDFEKLSNPNLTNKNNTEKRR